MKMKIKEIILLAFAFCAVLAIPVFLSKDKPIEISLSVLDAGEMAKQEAQQQKEEAAQAAQARLRRMISCQVDEDCIIVDQDPCGCLVGPKGVTSINAAYTLDFNRLHSGAVTKACPEGAPSMERECSPTAQAVCRQGLCKISY